MKKSQIIETVVEVIELLNKAKPGRPMLERTASRAKANELIVTLPNNWHRRIDPELVDAFQFAEA